MKKAYNYVWVKNLNIQLVAQSWVDKNLMTTNQFEDVKINFPESFYRPGIFIKIGLFLFTLVAGCFFAGFLSLFFLENGGKKIFSMLSLVCSICFFFVLEYLIKERKLFHSGIDNALLYMATVAAVIALVTAFESLKTWQYCLFVLLITVIVSLRYADLVTVFAAVLTTFALFGDILLWFPLGKAVLPFATMILSAGIYFLNTSESSVYYRESQTLIKVIVLLIFYLGGNYYVVREGNAIIADLPTPIAPQIPFAIVFYSLTAIIPLLYCYWGLRTKDRIFLIVGLVACAFSCFTYRYYFDFIPVEIALCAAGAALITLCTYCMNYFKSERFGLTDQMTKKHSLVDLQAILIAHQFGQTPEEKNINFGGGNFGGGGSGDNY